MADDDWVDVPKGKGGGTAVADEWEDVKPKAKEDALSSQLRQMTQGMSGQTTMLSPEEKAQSEAGKKEGMKAGVETMGGVLGGEAIPAIRGVLGAALRILGTGGGAAAGNVAGQLGTTGKVDPMEALKTGAIWGGTAGAGEAFGAALPALRSSLSRALYTPAGELNPLAKAVVHPTELPETLLRSVIKEAPEQVAARETFAKTKTIAEAQEAAAKMDTATQRLKDRIAAQAAKNAPKPSPFPEASSTAPQPGKIQTMTDSMGLRWAVAPDGMKVTVPKNVAEADVASYAGPKLAEQRQILGDIKGRTQAPGSPVTTSGLPQGNATPFPQVQKLSDLQGQDLISRTKTIVRPGEAPSAADLKRAGDLTQVPLAKLKQLADWGDELAKNEIRRRLRQ